VDSFCRNLILRCTIFLALASAGPSFATKFGDPERREVTSPNGEFVLVVDPETEIHTIAHTSAPTVHLWEFECPVWHNPFVLSDDGRTVAVVTWKHIQEQRLDKADAVTLYRSTGSLGGFGFDRVFPKPPKTSKVFEGGPVGEDWRTWYDEVTCDGRTLIIHRTDGGFAQVDLNKGLLGDVAGGPSKLPLLLLIGIAAIAVIGILVYKITVKKYTVVADPPTSFATKKKRSKSAPKVQESSDAKKTADGESDLP